MSNNISHPGTILNKLLIRKNLSQREFAAKTNISHSLLNNILNGNRAITTKYALSLETIGFESASFWLTKQMEYELYQERNSENHFEKQESIKLWSAMEKFVPVSYFRKQESLKIQNPEDILRIYGVDSLIALERKIKKINLTYFRKSSKFIEDKNNVIAWSLLAEHEASKQKVNSFNASNEQELIEKLKKCFYKNINTFEKTKEIFQEYGVKFLRLDRPGKTPVDGKCFMSGQNPAIAVSLKYKRLDNFAFNILHECGHVFQHLTNTKYKEINFYTNNSNQEVEEFEANRYAMNNLIDSKSWDEFFLSHEVFDDKTIIKFSKKIKVHPAIIRGRICHELPEYYRKRSAITKTNVIG